MVNEEPNIDGRTPGLLTWAGWIGLTALGGVIGSFLLSGVLVIAGALGAVVVGRSGSFGRAGL